MIQPQIKECTVSLAKGRAVDHTCASANNDVSRHIPKKPRLTLNSLPTELLDILFEYVQSYDLVKIMCLSSEFYWPAAARVYMSITILSHKRFMQATKESRHWKTNQGTLMPINKVEILVNSLKTKYKLRKLVQTLNLFQETLCLPLRELLSLTPNLRSYHDLHGFTTSRKLKRNLKSVSSTYNYYPKFNCYLVELRIICRESVIWCGDFSPLARDLIASNGYVNLRKLDFSVVGEDWEKKEMSTHTDGCPDSFFDEFVKVKAKLKLVSLGLFGDDHYTSVTEFANKIKESVELADLKILVLNFSKEGDSGAPHTLLELITENTPSLASLGVLHQLTWTDEGFIGLCNTLSHNIPNQLCELYIELDYYTYDRRKKIQEVIVAYQRNLMKLSIVDLDTITCDRLDFEIGVQIMNAHMKRALLREKRRAKFFPEVQGSLHSRPIISDTHAHCIEQWKKDIQNHLKDDLIYASADKHLPELFQYYAGKMFIDVKRKGIFANDRTICFEPEEQKESGKYHT